MREILFKGKTKTGEWIEGNFIDWGNHVQVYIFPLLNYATSYGLGDSISIHAKAVIPETVGQYTGLTDKNGKKIFEGDIIKQTFRLKQTNGCQERDVLSVIEYGISWNYSTVCGVTQRFKDGSGIAMLSVMNGTNGIVDCEIIGNIHDNPELMKGGE